jgi:hypothetical protein
MDTVATHRKCIIQVSSWGWVVCSHSTQEQGIRVSQLNQVCRLSSSVS